MIYEQDSTKGLEWTVYSSVFVSVRTTSMILQIPLVIYAQTIRDYDSIDLCSYI